LGKSQDEFAIYKESYKKLKKNLGLTYAKLKINLGRLLMT